MTIVSNISNLNVKFIAGAIILATALTLNANTAKAGFCDRHTAGRTLVATGIGAVLGGLVAGRSNRGEGMAIGAGLGFLTGLGISCADYDRERVHYLNGYDSYEEGYRWNHGRFSRGRSGLHRRYDYVCHEYTSTVYTRHGRKSFTEVSCRVNDEWTVYNARDVNWGYRNSRRPRRHDSNTRYFGRSGKTFYVNRTWKNFRASPNPYRERNICGKTNRRMLDRPVRVVKTFNRNGIRWAKVRVNRKLRKAMKRYDNPRCDDLRHVFIARRFLSR